MKYLLIEKSKRVSVKPYQRKGKYVIGHQREDPRNKAETTPAEHIGEPFEVIGTAFINVSSDLMGFIEKTIPKNELRDLKSIEEFSFKDFEECKTIPKEPYLSYLEKSYRMHPDYGGMYFHDISRFVLDKTNLMFAKYPTMKQTAFLHEIGHHQWWHHITTKDRREFISIWLRERIGKIVTDATQSGKRLEVLATSEDTGGGKYKVKNLGTGKIEKIDFYNIEGLDSITPYSNANAHEGFAEAYAEYRYGTLSEEEFPDTYHLLNEIFERRKKNVMVEALEGKKGEGVEVKEPTEMPLWKMNIEEWNKWKKGKPLQEITEGIHIRENGTNDSALNIVTSKPEITFPEIVKKMGIPEGRVGGALDRLEKKGLIKKQEAIMSPGGLKPSKYEALRKNG